MKSKLYGKRIASYKFFAYAYIVDADGTEVVVGAAQQMDKMGREVEVHVSGGVDPMIVSCLLMSLRCPLNQAAIGMYGGAAVAIGAGVLLA